MLVGIGAVHALVAFVLNRCSLSRTALLEYGGLVGGF